MNLIAYSLWGDSPKYLVGALVNARQMVEYFPGWKGRFYVDTRVPREVLSELAEMDHIEIVEMGVVSDWKALFWRFQPAAEMDVAVLLARDTDSRFTKRERAAIQEWLASDRNFHIMRDHPFHSRWPILGGLWGVRNGLMRNMNELVTAYTTGECPSQWGVDQYFLGEMVHPLVCSHALVHDDLSPSLEWDTQSERRPFPLARDGLAFVGQVFDEHEATVPEHVEILGNFLAARGQRV